MGANKLTKADVEHVDCIFHVIDGTDLQSGWAPFASKGQLRFIRLISRTDRPDEI